MIVCKSVPFTNVCKLLFTIWSFYFLFFFFFLLQRWGAREGGSQTFARGEGFPRAVFFMEQFFPHHQSGKHECLYKFRELRKAHFL